MLAEAVLTVDDRVLISCWPFLPTLDLMITHIIIMLTARITAITTSPITDVRSVMPNEVCVGGMLVGIFEVLVTVVVTIAVIVDMVSGVLSIVVILHSSMKS